MTGAEGISAIILAGGDSRRFGRDKAREPWRGRRLVDHVAAAFEGLADEILIVLRGDQDPGGWPADRVVTDDPGLPPGALRGVVSGLCACRTGRAWVVACDTPCLQPALLEALRCEAGPDDLAVAPVWNDRVQTLVACYARAAADPLAELALGGIESLQDALAAIDVRRIEPAAWRVHDPAALSFHNINTPEHLAALEAALDAPEEDP